MRYNTDGLHEGGRMDLHFLRLWDIYNPLLTQHQREITDLYFNCDLSLAEIAEEKGCSRQSISDTLQKARRLMEDYEEKLHLLRHFTEISLTQSFLMTELTRWAQTLPEQQRGEAEAILHKDFSAEVAEAIERNSDTLL